MVSRRRVRVLRLSPHHQHVLGHVEETTAGPGRHLSAAPSEAVTEILMLVVSVPVEHQEVLAVATFHHKHWKIVLVLPGIDEA